MVCVEDHSEFPGRKKLQLIFLLVPLIGCLPPSLAASFKVHEASTLERAVKIYNQAKDIDGLVNTMFSSASPPEREELKANLTLYRVTSSAKVKWNGEYAEILDDRGLTNRTYKLKSRSGKLFLSEQELPEVTSTPSNYFKTLAEFLRPRKNVQNLGQWLLPYSFAAEPTKDGIFDKFMLALVSLRFKFDELTQGPVVEIRRMLVEGRYQAPFKLDCNSGLNSGFQVFDKNQTEIFTAYRPEDQAIGPLTYRRRGVAIDKPNAKQKELFRLINVCCNSSSKLERCPEAFNRPSSRTVKRSSREEKAE